jgi:hypothetical protein
VIIPTVTMGVGDFPHQGKYSPVAKCFQEKEILYRVAFP